MALTREEIDQLGAVIGKAIAGSSGVDVITDYISRSEKQNKVQANREEDILRVNKKIANDLKNRPAEAEKVVKSTVSRLADKLAGIKELPEHFKDAMEASGSVYLERIAGEIETLADVQSAQKSFGSMQNIGPIIDEFIRGEDAFETTFQKIMELGLTAEEASAVLQPFGEIQQDNNGKIKKNSKNLVFASRMLDQFETETKVAGDALHDFGDQVDSAKEQRSKLSKAGNKLKQVFYGLSGAGMLLLDNLRSSAKFGADLDIFGANIRGMQMGEWAETLADSRRAVLSLSGGLEQFEGIVSAGAAMSLTAFTGDLGEATKGLVDMTMNSRMMGDSAIDSADFVSGQTAMFKQLHNTLAMTIQDFTQLNRELLNDVDVRNLMIRMTGTERRQKFEQLQQDYKYYSAQGLLHDQAVSLAKTMDRMAGKDPRERMKEAARMSAVMSAVGMDTKKAGRAQELIVKGGRRTGEETQELVMLTKEVNALIQEQKGDSLAGEMAAAALVERAGIAERLATSDDLLMAEGQVADKNVQAQMANQKSLAKQILGPIGEIQTLLSPAGPIGAAIIATAAILGTALLPILVPILAIGAAVTGVVAVIQSLYGVFAGDGTGDNFIYQAFKAILPDMGDIIGGTIHEAMENLSPLNWFDDDASEQAEERKRIADETFKIQERAATDTQSSLERIREEISKGNTISETGNDKIGKNVDEAKKGNALSERQINVAGNALRTYKVRSAFPGVPNPA